MARLICSAITSLDGYIEDPSGGFDWAAPDEELQAFVNDLKRPVGTHLSGRRMHEVMRVWEHLDGSTDPPPGRVGPRGPSGGPPRRSCTPRRWPGQRHPGRNAS